MSEKILVFLEQRDGEIKKSSLETIKFADLIAQKKSAEIEAVVLGNELNNSSLPELGIVKKVNHIKN